MRIVHYGPWALAGETGTAASIVGWCTALARVGVDVRLLVDGDAVRRQPPSGTRWVPIRHRYRGRLRVPIGLGPALAGADVVVVHGGWTTWNISAGRQAAENRVPYIVTTHGVYYVPVLRRRPAIKRVWYRAIERSHLERALAMHAFFDDEIEGMKQLGISTPTIVAPNGVMPQDVRWDGGPGGYVLWLGRFDSHTKALDLLVRSLLEIGESERPSLRLHGPDFRGNKERLAALTRDAGLTRWVTIGDPIYGEEKRRTLARAAVFAYPSRWDASPMAVAEAIGAGVPTLVADYPLGRLLAGHGAALLCDRTPVAIAHGIRRLLSDEGRVIGGRAEHVARDHLSWDAVARSWLEQAERLLKQARDTI